MECRKAKLDLGRRHVMTILNVTPDSFFEGSRTSEAEAIGERAREAIEAGATIIDVGGYSSRPNAEEVSIEEEWRRVDLGVGVVRSITDSISKEVAISVDTFRAEVVRRAVEKYGEEIIVNDIMAGEWDRDGESEPMFDIVAKHNLCYIAMHMRGTPQSMQSMVEYRDVAEEVIEYFRERIKVMRDHGVERIILDPGFGFAKSLKQNYELLAALPRLCELGYPVLAGLSRKSMIYRALEIETKDALAGTIALGWEALRQGATILRVHDTIEAVQSVKLYEIYNRVK
ncbi:MAG: dihydropteroate synthase [Rikenellaceae bacterium]